VARRKREMGPVEKRWYEVATRIVDKTLERLERWCEYHHDYPLECYGAHLDMDVGSILDLYGDLTEEENEKILKMPEKYYRRYIERPIQRFIERKFRYWERFEKM